MGFRLANSGGSCTSETEDCIRSMADGWEDVESATPPTAKEDGMSRVAVRRGGAESDKGAIKQTNQIVTKCPGKKTRDDSSDGNSRHFTTKPGCMSRLCKSGRGLERRGFNLQALE